MLKFTNFPFKSLVSGVVGVKFPSFFVSILWRTSLSQGRILTVLVCLFSFFSLSFSFLFLKYGMDFALYQPLLLAVAEELSLTSPKFIICCK